ELLESIADNADRYGPRSYSRIEDERSRVGNVVEVGLGALSNDYSAVSNHVSSVQSGEVDDNGLAANNRLAARVYHAHGEDCIDCAAVASFRYVGQVADDKSRESIVIGYSPDTLRVCYSRA